MALLSLGRAVSRYKGPQGGLDFHSYWYSGHFVRQGDDPYQAFFDHSQPQLPVAYSDGPVVNQPPVAQPELVTTPANTAPLVLLLTAFSFFSWPAAKLAWFAINLASALAIPWLALKLLPAGWMTTTQKSVIILSFYVFSGTRIATWMGQTTLFVLLLMLLSAVTWKRSWLWSGILLGLALSKYSLAFPVLLLALYRRKTRVVIAALGVQIAGALAISAMSGTSLFDITKGYLRMAEYHASLQGVACYQCIHLGSLITERTLAVDALILAGAGLILALFCYWLWRSSGGQGEDEKAVIDILALSAFTQWVLVAGYHRSYDSEAAVIFVAAIVTLFSSSELSPRVAPWRHLILYFLIGFIFILALPGEIMDVLLPDELLDYWLRLLSIAMTVALTGGFVVSWLLLRQLMSEPRPVE